MRKPKDFDSELKALDERVKQIRERKLHQLGELVVATGADELPIDILTGALLSAVQTKDASTREGWRARGAAFFQQTKRKQGSAGSSAASASASGSGTLPLAGGAGAK